MTLHEKLARFAELEAQAKADETDWESFFQAAELWEEIMEEHTWENDTAEQRYQTYRWLFNLAEAMKPGPWKRLWTTITKRTKR